MISRHLIAGSLPFMTLRKCISSKSTPTESTRALRRSLLRNPNAPSYAAPRSLPLVETVSKFLDVKTVTSITAAEGYDIPKVIELLRQQGYQPTNVIPNEIVSFKYLKDGCQGEIMVIAQNGSVVSWGFDEFCQRNSILPLIEKARINPLQDGQFETEDLDYIELDNQGDRQQLQDLLDHSDKNESFIQGDLIVLDSMSGDNGLLDKAAFSSGLSRSTRLAVLEGALEAHIETTRSFTELLSKGMKLKLTEADVLKSTGRLFLIRGKLNLYSELIETPDLYWSEPKLEKLYKQMSRNLDIQPRISILNKKLDYATDESRALMAVLNEKKSTYLEWIIIYLITVEVFFELYHFYEKATATKVTGTTD